MMVSQNRITYLKTPLWWREQLAFTLFTYFIKLSQRYKADIYSCRLFLRLIYHRSLKGVEGVIIFRVCEQHLERLSVMAYQKEHMLTSYSLYYKSWHELNGGADARGDATASFYSQYTLACKVSNPRRVEPLWCGSIASITGPTSHQLFTSISHYITICHIEKAFIRGTIKAKLNPTPTLTLWFFC